MTKITVSDVAHLASLSNLSLSDDEAESLQAELQAILGYVDQLATLDTSGVEPTYQVNGLRNVWRKDEVSEKIVTREALLDLAPDQQANQIKVPKVL